MKFRAHDTFFIRKGWLNKGMRNVVEAPDVFVVKDPNPMDVLGIGSNMVKALRYWLQAVGITTEHATGKRTQELTELGKEIFTHDRYIEELGTLYLLQYKLATNKELATSWYFFFNYFNMQDFTEEDFVSQIKNFIDMEDPELKVAERSLEDDFVCIINTYVPRYKTAPDKVSAENNIDCPFGELGLIDIISRDKRGWTYSKSHPSPHTFNPWVILAVIVDQAEGKKEIPLNTLLTSPGNIGMVYNLDSIAMLEILHKVEHLGEIKIIRTAGLDIIKIINDYSFYDCIEKYYSQISE